MAKSSESGLTFRPTPEDRRIMQEIQEATGLPFAKMMHYALHSWLEDTTDAAIQLYRLRLKEANRND